MSNVNNVESVEPKERLNFLEEIIEESMAKGEKKVQTRFPPEPNGYLHIGHAKAICLDFGVAAKYGGVCNLRFDDTNPTKEKTEYVQSILEDVKWLGADFEDRLYFASDYFDQMYEGAVKLIKKGKAFVCDFVSSKIKLVFSICSTVLVAYGFSRFKGKNRKLYSI